MRARREKWPSNPQSSFRVLVTPHLENVFLWHYHPEYELVYIEGTDGARHIGEHLARYEGGDLAFIRPNVPHLNFDYGADPNHTKIVVQLHADFMGPDFLRKPEMATIQGLFERPEGATCFTGATKARIGERLKQMIEANGFRQLMALLDIFHELAESADATPVSARAIASEQDFRDQQRWKKIERYVAEHYAEPVETEVLTALTGLSAPAFCRYFKKTTGDHFTAYLNAYRIKQACTILLADGTVTEACFMSGFENLSYFNRVFKKIMGENPLEFKKKWRMGQKIA